jgi:hypothetical protein
MGCKKSNSATRATPLFFL